MNLNITSKRYGNAAGKAPVATANPFGQQSNALRAGKTNPATKHKSKKGGRSRKGR